MPHDENGAKSSCGSATVQTAPEIQGSCLDICPGMQICDKFQHRFHPSTLKEIKSMTKIRNRDRHAGDPKIPNASQFLCADLLLHVEIC